MQRALLIAAFVSAGYASAGMKIVNPGESFIAGFDWPSDHAYFNFKPLGCSPDNAQGSYSCSFDFTMRSSRKDEPVIFLKNFIATYPDGSSKSAEKFAVDGKDYIQDTRLQFLPGDTHRLVITFPLPNQTFSKLKFLDVGYQEQDADWTRITNLPISGSVVTALPAPQAMTNPEPSLSASAPSGYATLSGVALNGGMYDVTLQGCRVTDPGLAACVLSLAPMRATPQGATLEHLNVTVGGQSVQASATAAPAVTILTITAPVSVDRIDELRLGNARFQNIGVR